MNKVIGSVWVNVSTSAKWTRPAVGIVRVERFLSDELAKLYGDRLKKCVWENDRFIEWDASQAEASCGKKNNINPQARKRELPYIYPLLPKRQALSAIVQGLLSLAPLRIRPYLNSFLSSLRPFVLKLLTHNWVKMFLKPVIKRLGNKQAGHPSLIYDDQKISTPFSPGDIFISIGLDWDSPYYKTFYKLRTQLGIKIVTCCYDLIPVLYPQYCSSDVAGIFTSYFFEIADGSDLVLCISKKSETDFNELLMKSGCAQPPTKVFPLGDNLLSAKNDEISFQVSSACQTPFILFVSTIERRKNHEVLYRAYHLLCKQGMRDRLPRLIFVGMQGWGVDELMKDIHLDPLTQGLIVTMGHVNDTELRVLYESALFCVFPSLYEGWGLPVGEALVLGKAVLCSDRGALPEVGGDSVRYVDPWNTQAWADEISRMVTDDIWRRQWELKAKEQYKSRAWSEAALVVKDGIENLI